VEKISDKFIDAFCAARGCCGKETINRTMARMNIGFVLEAMDRCGLVMVRAPVEESEIEVPEDIQGVA